MLNRIHSNEQNDDVEVVDFDNADKADVVGMPVIGSSDQSDAMEDPIDLNKSSPRLKYGKFELNVNNDYQP